jgi:hypothetical protein
MSLRTSTFRGSLACSGVGVLLAGQPQIDELGPAAGRNDDVGGFDVAVHDAGGRRMDEGRRHLQRVVDRIGRSQPALSLNQVPQIGACDVLEGDEVQAAIFADVVDAGNVIVVQPGGGPGFILEPLHRTGIAGHGRRKHLERHHPLQPLVHRAKHRAHPAHADPFFNHEVLEPRAGRTSQHVLASGHFGRKQPGPQRRTGGRGWLGGGRQRTRSPPLRIDHGIGGPDGRGRRKGKHRQRLA